MRIVLATALYPPEIAAPASYVRELAQNLAKENQVTIVAYAIAADEISGVAIVAVEKRRSLLRRLWSYTIALYRAAKTADIILVQHAAAASLPALVVGRLRRIPVVIRVFEDEAWQRARSRRPDLELEEYLAVESADRKERLLAYLQGLALHRSAMVIVPNSWFGGLIVKRYRIPDGRMETVYDPDPRPIALPFAVERSPDMIAAIDTLSPGTDALIRAAAIAREKFPNLKVIIAGDGIARAELQALVSSLALNDCFEFLGHVSTAEAWYLRRTANAVVHMHPGADAATDLAADRLCSVAVIAPDSPAFREFANYDPLIHLVPENDPAKLAERLVTVLESPASAGASAGVRSDRDWRGHVTALTAVLDNISGNGSRDNSNRHE